MSRPQRPIDRIAPDGFVQEIDEQAPGREIDTVDGALAYASRWLRSSTDPAEQHRCPECESRRVRLRVGRRRTPDDSKYMCDGCEARFDRPLPPLCRIDEPEDDDTETMNDTETPDFDWIDSDDLEHPGVRHRKTIRGLTDTERVELALRLYRPWTDDGPSYRDLARLFPYGRAWIGERVRRWKRGEYRDIVPGPWPTVDASSGGRAVATDGGET